MYQNKAIIDSTGTAQENKGSAFVSTYCWSSTEFHKITAWALYFDSGGQSNDYKANTDRVRAVRAFLQFNHLLPRSCLKF